MVRKRIHPWHSIPPATYTVRRSMEDLPATVQHSSCHLPAVLGRLRVCYVYRSNDGGLLSGPVVLDSSGNLYGTAGGGTTGDGLVFELSPGASGWTEAILHAFTTKSDGHHSLWAGLLKTGNARRRDLRRRQLYQLPQRLAARSLKCHKWEEPGRKGTSICSWEEPTAPIL